MSDLYKNPTRPLKTLTPFNALMYAALCVYTVFILFYNLSDRYFWADEAETADLAVNITRFGLPRAYDGKNYISLYGPSIFENKSNIVTWRPWLDEYLAAASFKAFGHTTTAGRIPFVTFGAAAVFLMALLSYRIFKSHSAAISATVLVAASELFVLHVRQCRYYSVVIFAEIALILALYNLLTGKKKSGIIILTASLALQFYTNYIVMGGSIFALGILALLTRKRNKGFLSSFVVSMSAFSIIAAPWLIYAKPWVQSGFVGRGDIVSKLQFYISEIHFNIFPLILIFIPPAYYLFRWLFPNSRGAVFQKVPAIQRDIISFLILTIPFTLVIVSLAPEIYIRYVVHLIPVFVLLTVFLLTNYVRPVWLRLTLICLMCFTNYISYAAAYPFKSLNEPLLVVHSPKVTIYHLIKNTLADSTNQLEDTVNFMKKESKPTDTVLSSCPEFALIFYTGMRVVNARFLETVDLKTLPEWIFPECISEDTSVEPLYPPLKYAQYYTPVTFAIHDGPVIGNMPVPDIYGQFTSQQGISQVTIFRLNFGAAIDITNEKTIFKPVGFQGNVISVKVSSDGRFIVAAGSHNRMIDSSGQVKIIDIKTGAVVHEISSNIHPIKSAFLTPDGKSIIGIVGNTVKRWDIDTGKKRKTFAGHKDQINAIALVPGGNQLLSAAKNDRLKLWDITSGKELSVFAGAKSNITAIAVTSDGRYAVSAGTDNRLKLWDIKSGTEVKTFVGNTKDIKTIAISKSGRFMLTGGGYDGAVRVWDIELGREVRALMGHKAPVSSIVITPDDLYAVSGGATGLIRVWNIESGSEAVVFSEDSRHVSSLSLTPDGKSVAAGSWNGTVSVWDTATGKCLSQMGLFAKPHTL
ncbi:hypothetical protein [Candidatus Magnetomonas plexicatena]|uniref:hypothetical protein n=1 Tax=Candidatus Magnetomonas plexicatena TaxID=2552947 RepID=UPI001C76EBBC|nr:hypothetical protein E2O03_006315 [Nitrospirales bacterium LBB_01]